VLDGDTSTSRIRVDETGDRHFEHEDFGVCAAYRPAGADLERLAGFGAVHIGLLADPAPVRRALAGRGVLVSQDCAISPGYAGLDIAFCSAAAVAGAEGAAGADGVAPAAIARAAVAGGARLCVVTCGAAGSIAHDGRDWWQVPAVSVEVVDTTGAGDSYIAGFLHARLTGADVPEAMHAAAVCAGQTCTHLGAWPQQPAPLR
jgi:fructoselysine 6-kinase